MSNNDSRSIGLLIQLALLCVLSIFSESQHEGLNFISSGHKQRQLLPDFFGHISPSAPTHTQANLIRWRYFMEREWEWKWEWEARCLHWPGLANCHFLPQWRSWAGSVLPSCRAAELPCRLLNFIIQFRHQLAGIGLGFVAIVANMVVSSDKFNDLLNPIGEREYEDFVCLLGDKVSASYSPRPHSEKKFSNLSRWGVHIGWV